METIGNTYDPQNNGTLPKVSPEPETLEPSLYRLHLSRTPNPATYAWIKGTCWRGIGVPLKRGTGRLSGGTPASLGFKLLESSFWDFRAG